MHIMRNGANTNFKLIYRSSHILKLDWASAWNYSRKHYTTELNRFENAHSASKTYCTLLLNSNGISSSILELTWVNSIIYFKRFIYFIQIKIVFFFSILFRLIVKPMIFTFNFSNFSTIDKPNWAICFNVDHFLHSSNEFRNTRSSWSTFQLI